MSTFSTPLSGLTAAQGQLQSVSNNLANINTDGYKDQTLTFADVFSQTGVTNGSGDPLQTGSGVAISATNSDFTEGNLNVTALPRTWPCLAMGSLSLRVRVACPITHAPAIFPPTKRDKSSHPMANWCWDIPRLTGWWIPRRL